MMIKLQNYVKLVLAYLKHNLRSHLEYRAAFASQAVSMFINNGVWLVFWALFFHRFPVLKGWDIKDVITLWAVASAGFGMAHTACGNALHIASIVAKGQLDAWMLYPRALLPHLVLGKMNPTACGDAMFGYVVYVLLVKPDIPHFLLFVVLTAAIAILFVGFSILVGSVSFFVGNSEGLSEQWLFSMLTLSTYPDTLFEGTVRLLLYTVVPAAFVNYLPVEALRSLSIGHAALTLAGSTIFLLLGSAAFYWGLSRYESGNLMEMRG